MADSTVAPLPHAPRGQVPRPRRRWGRILNLAMLTAIAVSVVVFWDELPDIGAVWSAAVHADPGWLAVVAVGALVSMSAFARIQRRLLRTGGLRMSLRRAFAVTYAGNALSTTLPAGPAMSIVFTFQQFRRSGASAQLATAVIVIGWIVTTSAYWLIALLALLGEPHSRGPVLWALAGLAVAVAVVALILSRRAWRARVTAELRSLVGAVSRHRWIAPHVAKLRTASGMLRPTRGDLGVLTLLALLNWTADILALYAAARSVGIEISPYAIALAYYAAQAAGSLLTLLPGGLGAIESSMAAALVAFGAPFGPAAAAVALYRLASFWIVVSIGWLSWFALRGVHWPTGFWRAVGTGMAATAAYPLAYQALPPAKSSRPA